MADTAVRMRPNVPVTTKLPTLLVQGLEAAGVYVVRLVVTDELGLSSQPATLKLTVTAQG